MPLNTPSDKRLIRKKGKIKCKNSQQKVLTPFVRKNVRWCAEPFSEARWVRAHPPPSSAPEPASGQHFDSNAPLQCHHVLLTRGMQVMLTANTDLGNCLSNDSIGMVGGIIFINATDEMLDVFVKLLLAVLPCQRLKAPIAPFKGLGLTAG